MLELREHMRILCKMCISQEKAVTQQDVNLTRAPTDKIYVTESMPISSTFMVSISVPALSFFELLSVDCDERYISQKTISSSKLFQVFIIAIET